MLPLDQNQRHRAVDPSISVIATAPAGSGKTAVLLIRYLNALSRCEKPEEVLAITFTNKAASEIKERVIRAMVEVETNAQSDDEYSKELSMAASAVLARNDALRWGIITNPDRLRIMTFDGYCHQLTKLLPLLSGLGSIDVTDNPKRLYEEAIFTLLGEVDNKEAPALLRESLRFVLAYSKNQYEVLVPILSNLLSKRDQWINAAMSGSIEQQQTSFTAIVEAEFHLLRKKLNPILEPVVSILKEASVHDESLQWAASICDIHSASQSELSAMASICLSQSNTLRKKVDKRLGFPAKMSSTIAMNEYLQQIRGSNNHSEIEQMLAAAKTLPDRELPANQVEAITHIYTLLRYLLASLRLTFETSGVVDFTEVALRAIQSLSDDQLFGDALLKEERVRHLLVDEMQDTNFTQIWLLEKLCQDWQEGDGRSLFFCGDPVQSIYNFRGALVHHFTTLLKKKCFANKPLEVINLTANFRSSDTIVKQCNEIFGQLIPQQKDVLETPSPFIHADPQRGTLGNVGFTLIEGNELAEAEYTVSLVKDSLLGGCNDIAILVRNRNHLNSVVKLLNKEGIKYSGHDMHKLTQSYGVRIVNALSRSLWHREDKAAWLSVLRSPLVGLSWEDCLLLSQAECCVANAIRERSDKLSAYGQAKTTEFMDAVEFVEASQHGDQLEWRVRSLWARFKGDAMCSDNELVDVDRYFLFLAKQTVGGTIEDIGEFEASLDQLYASASEGVVKLMTIHKSKGLEFEHVIIHGAGNSARVSDLPLLTWHQYDDNFAMCVKPLDVIDTQSQSAYGYLRGKSTQAETKELDRLIYVAFTRAKSQLNVVGRSCTGRSMFSRLLPLLGSIVVVHQCCDSEEDNQRLSPPLVRIPENAGESNRPVYRTPDLHHYALGEDVLDQHRELKTPAQILGMVYHLLIEKLSTGVLLFENVSVELLKSLLVNKHYPLSETNMGADQLYRYLKTTITGSTGRWIIQPRPGAVSECEIYIPSRTVRRIVIDRMFEENDATWIIDYKTSAPAIHESVRDFITKQVHLHSQQLGTYRQAVMSFTHVRGPVKACLYFPAIDRLVDVNDCALIEIAA